MRNKLSNMKTKAVNRIRTKKTSNKKGMAAIGWILTIVFTLAVVGLIWVKVKPAVVNTADDASSNIETTTSTILNDAAGTPGN